MLWCSFRHETYYLSEHAADNIRNLNEADFMPKIDDFVFKIISTNLMMDDLEAEGLEFRLHDSNARKYLDKGAIAFCIFVGQELAHISWAAMTEEAKKSLGEPPYRVDFSSGEVCTTRSWTSPHYRRRGLGQYVAFQARQFLCENGKGLVRDRTSTGNIVSRQSYVRLGRKFYAEARYLKILWWESWKEKPLEQPNVPPE